MSEDWRMDEALPQRVRDTLERLCDSLKKTLGDRLVSFLLFGPVAKGDSFHPRTTSVDTLLVLSDTSLATLEGIGPTITRAQIDLRISVMLMTPADMKSSADVFPSKFIDIQDHHRVLLGTDPLAEIEILKDHLRLRCEQDLKNLLLAVRLRVLRTASNPKKMLDTLGDMGSQFVDVLRTLIRLRGGPVPALRADVVDHVSDLGVDEDLLDELLAIDNGRSTPTPSQAKALADRLLSAVAHAAAIADTHKGPPGRG